jgi:predicted ribosome quality control (RQC) complex YloA/Tae2 family protein
VTLSAGHIGELVRELGELVRGAAVKEVLGLPPRDLLLVLATDPVRRLRVSADPRAGRLHLQIGRTPRHDGPVGPFFRTLASVLEGARLVELAQVDLDRIVRLRFARPDDAGGRGGALVAELVGRNANLVLLDADGSVRAVLVPPKETAGEAPRLRSGAPYAPPAGGAPRPSAPLVEAFPDPGDGPALAGLAPLSWRVERSLGAEAVERREDELRTDLVRRLERRRQNTLRLIAGLEKQRAEAATFERVRADGELIKANLGRVARGSREVTVPDFFEPDTPPRRIVLDPRLSPLQNAERAFARARKLERSRAKVEAELGRAQAQLESFEAFLARAADAAGDPAALEADALAAGALRPRQEAPARRRRGRVVRRLPYRAFAALRGAEIRVGKSASDNDRLTFREARGNDLWLHTAEAPGSHVVLRV